MNENGSPTIMAAPHKTARGDEGETLLWNAENALAIASDQDIDQTL